MRLLLDLPAEFSQTGQSLAFANKQFTIQLLFQAFYLLRDSGLHQKQFFGGARNAEIVVDQGDQVCNWRKSMPAVYHHIMIYIHNLSFL